MIELYLIVIRCRHASSAARRLGEPSARAILRTIVTWFGVELGVFVLIGIPLVGASELWFPLHGSQLDVALALFVYPFALLAASEITLRQVRSHRVRTDARTPAA